MLTVRDLNLHVLSEEEDLDAIASAFLAAMPADRVEKTKKALEVLLPAYKAGTIYNADFTAWKAIVDRSFEEAWNDLVRTDYETYWMPDKKTVSPRGEISNAFGYVSGVRNAIALTKQAAKLKIQDPHLDAVKKLLAVALPIANIFEKLKTMTVKGRKPASPEQAAKKQAQLAKKTIRTCACCFRPIATLSNGKIADHGYTLPHPGNKSMSCPGRRFRPLEVSDDGLKYMVDLYTSWVEQDETKLHNAPNVTTLYKKSFSNKQGTPVVKGEPEWNILYKQHVAELKASLERDTAQLQMFKEKLANWKPAPATESLRDLTAQLRSLA